MSTTALAAPDNFPRPPVLGSTNVLGHMSRFRSDPLALFVEGRAMGDIVRMRVANRYLNVIYHPDGVHQVLVGNHQNYVKQTRGYQQLRRILGNGLVTSEGDFWKRQRRIAQPAFNHRRLGGFADIMLRATNDLALRWEDAVNQGHVVDVAESMNRLALRIAGETLFSLDISGEANIVGVALHEMLGGFLKTITNPLRNYLPLPSTLRYRRAQRELDGVVYSIIRRRREEDPNGEDQGDLLGMFMAARDEDGTGMSDLQLRDEVLTMLLAGHETTANALAWTFSHLAGSPAVLSRLQGEVDSVMPDGEFSLEKYPQLTYTEQVLKESMRLTPPVWVESRMAVADDVICGHRVPAGSFVFMSQYAMHRHPKYWLDAEHFDPDRFGPGIHLTPSGAPRPRGAYFPFSDGQRKCIGEHFANMEARILLSILVRRFSFERTDSGPVLAEPSVTLRPRGGVPMRLTRRKLWGSIAAK